MKHIVWFLVFCFLVGVSYAAISQRYEPVEVVSCVPVDVRHTEAHSQIETTYEYKYNLLKGDFALVPDIHTVYYEESWEVLERKEYSNGQAREEWRECSEIEYNKTKIELNID